jgi:hypothetical protein
MFDTIDSANREFDPEQFIEWDRDGTSDLEPNNCVTLIGRENYGLEVEMSGYVCVEKDLLDAETFLASLYPQL